MEITDTHFPMGESRRGGTRNEWVSSISPHSRIE